MLTLTKKTHRTRISLTPLLLALFLMIVPVIPVLAFDIPKQTDAFYVNDTVDLISEENEDYIIGTCEDLYAKTGAQVVVVTINSLEGTSIEEYATELFRSYGIGDAEKNNGVLVLLSYDDHECRIEVGYGLEGAINDGKAGRIMDNYMIPYFRDGQWDEGIVNGFDAIMDEICTEYDVEITHQTPNVPSKTATESSGSNDMLGIYIIAAVIGLAGGAFMGYAFPGQAMIPGSIYLILAIIFMAKVFPPGTKLLSISAALATYLIGWGITSPDVSGGSGGSSYGGYSSSSRSSGGSSRSYNSGGGGRSGGGGASRKW